MRRVLVIAACSSMLAACSSGGDWFKSAPQTLTLQFESEPQGAEVKTSGGQTCRTPCALAVPATEMTASFNLKGYKPATVPVAVMQPEFPQEDPNPKFSPNPVYAELESMGPPKKPAPVKKPAVAVKKKPAPAANPDAAAQQQPAAAPAPAPAPAGASPWPAPPPPQPVR